MLFGLIKNREWIEERVNFITLLAPLWIVEEIAPFNKLLIGYYSLMEPVLRKINFL